MKPLQRQRFIFIVCIIACVGGGIYLILHAFQRNITFFYTPSDKLPVEKKIRLGGVVKENSLKKELHALGQKATFIMTDFHADTLVIFEGALPDLFREGQGVIAEGTWHPGAPPFFYAETIFAKHDETYMPPEVAASLKKKGLWPQGSGVAPKLGE